MELDYNLELDKVVEEVKRASIAKNGKPVKACLQFPDGLKANATEIVKELERLTKNQKPKTAFFIWAGSNFGGCDYPWYLKDLGFDLLVNFGHSVFRKWPDSAGKQN